MDAIGLRPVDHILVGHYAFFYEESYVIVMYEADTGTPVAWTAGAGVLGIAGR